MAKRLLSKSFGEVVRTCRGKVKLTQESLAERASVHPTYIGLVERGERNCSLDVAAEIAEALGTPLSKLIEEAEARNKKSGSLPVRKGEAPVMSEPTGIIGKIVELLRQHPEGLTSAYSHRVGRWASLRGIEGRLHMSNTPWSFRMP